MRRINGQFDDRDAEYKLEKIETVSGFVTTWSLVRRGLTLRNAELMRRNIERDGGQARVRHESEY